MRDAIERARGRWRQILPVLGVPLQFLDGKHQPCPMCGGKDRARFDDKDGRGTYYCNQCGPGSGIKLVMRVNNWEFNLAAAKVAEVLGDLPPPTGMTFVPRNPRFLNSYRKIWLQSVAVTTGDPVHRYLTKRGLKGPFSRALRYVPRMYDYASRRFYPGMLALMCDPSGKPCQLHRTYLTLQGTKADMPSPRKFMAGSLPYGGAIRLGDPAETMGVAEGIETALSAAQMFDMPVWATLSELALQRWIPPPEAKVITVFADHDRNMVGQAAAYVLARDLLRDAQRTKIGRFVDVKLPHVVDWDFNDVLKGGEAPCVN